MSLSKAANWLLGIPADCTSGIVRI